MTDVERAAAIRGKRIRMTWTAGPTKGSTHEHVFHQDGTVEWYDPGVPKSSPGEQGAAGREKPQYAAITVADDIHVVSYLSASGYTLTVVLNFRQKTVVGFASSSKDWYPVQGKLEVMN